MTGSAGDDGLRVESVTEVSPYLAVAAHELKSPLALVRQLGLALAGDDLTDFEREDLQRQVVLTAERALRLTTDLTRATRLEGGLFDVEPVNPLQLMEEVAHELKPLYRARNRRLQVAVHKKSFLALANRDLLRRVVVNFCDNALHYSSADAPVELRVATKNHGKTVRLSVRDFGPAVATDMWRAIKQRKTKQALPLHARPGSSGLGIMIAEEFAGAMNAQIGVVRHRDGASFFIDVSASTQLSLL